MNDIYDRIIIDYDSVKDDITGIIKDISSLRNDSLFSKAISKETAQVIKEHEIAINKRLNDKFSLVIIGDFKRGKTALVNAILGEKILPSAVTPETVTINRLSYSDTPKAEAVLESGKRAALDVKELKRDILERLLPQLPGKIDYIDVKAKNEILREISIVDTPGVGDLMNEFDDKVADYLINADALIYVVSARSPLSASEQMFISSAIIPQSFSRIMVVVNMSDTLETEQNIEKIRKLMEERTGCIGENINIYMLSALDELCRKTGKDRPCEELEKVLEINFLEFEDDLNNDIILQKDIIKATRGVALTEMMLTDIHARVELVINSLNISIDDLNANLQEFKNEDSKLRQSIECHKNSIYADIEKMKSEAISWISEFMARLKIEMESIQGSVSMSDVERHFQFFMMDTIKDAATACIQLHKEEISTKTADTIKDMAKETASQLFGDVSTTVSSCITDVSWTGVDTASFALDYLGLSGSFGLISIVGQAIMGFIRQKKIAERQVDYISPVLDEYETIVSDVISSITKIYDRLKFNAVDIVEEAYQNQVQASVAAISQAKEIMLDKTAKKEDVMDYLNTVISRINDFKEVLDKYK